MTNTETADNQIYTGGKCEREGIQLVEDGRMMKGTRVDEYSTRGRVLGLVVGGFKRGGT